MNKRIKTRDVSYNGRLNITFNYAQGLKKGVIKFYTTTIKLKYDTYFLEKKLKLLSRFFIVELILINIIYLNNDREFQKIIK